MSLPNRSMFFLVGFSLYALLASLSATGDGGIDNNGPASGMGASLQRVAENAVMLKAVMQSQNTDQNDKNDSQSASVMAGLACLRRAYEASQDKTVIQIDDQLNQIVSNPNTTSLNQSTAQLAQELLMQYQVENGNDCSQLIDWISKVARKKSSSMNNLLASRTSSGAGLMGKAIGSGLAGNSGSYLLFGNGVSSNASLGSMIAAGLTYRTMFVVGDEFEKLIRKEGAPIVDTVVGGPLRGFKARLKKIWLWLFHGGSRPYTLELVGHWKTEVKEVILKGLAQYAAKATSGQSDGFGARPRAQRFDDFGNEEVEEVKVEEVKDVTWTTFVDGLARDLDRLTLRMEVPKRYYSPLDDNDEAEMNADGRLDVLDTATRIQEVLQFIKTHILLPSRTLKDLAADQIKYLLPRVEDEITARFTLFESMITQYHHQSVGSSSIARSSSSSAKKESSNNYSDAYIGG